MENNQALTAQDVADILKIAKNTVYELIKRGELNSYKVGRKVRFTQEDVDEYIKRSKTIQPSPQVAEPIKSIQQDTADIAISPSQSGDFIICGQDLMLDVLSSQVEHFQGIRTLRSYIGSYNALVNLYQGNIQVATAHLWDGDSDTYNIPYVRRLLPGIPTVIINLAYRTQGLYIRKGNPKKISGWKDFGRDDLVMINREKGAGSRILLDEHLRQMGIDAQTINGYNRESQSHFAVASIVSRGGADLAVGQEKVALQMKNIDFIPLQKERYDLVIKKSDLNAPAIKAILEIIRSDEYRMEFEGITGYDISEMGNVIAEL
ncbi:helix-turn-helix transcriptional regulator [Eubacteriaceae bacterium ES3]|nr:helix-turn-helix transcriptional regulator [Eubacteriaceae bacterium ES3]